MFRGTKTRAHIRRPGEKGKRGVVLNSLTKEGIVARGAVEKEQVVGGGGHGHAFHVGRVEAEVKNVRQVVVFGFGDMKALGFHLGYEKLRRDQIERALFDEDGLDVETENVSIVGTKRNGKSTSARRNSTGAIEALDRMRRELEIFEERGVVDNEPVGSRVDEVRRAVRVSNKYFRVGFQRRVI